MVNEVALLVREEMEDFVSGRSAFSHKLMGACGISSWVLDRVCKRLGIKSTFVMGHWHKLGEHGPDPWNNHCWVQVDDKIYDVTATQFEVADRVHVTDASDVRYRPKHLGLSAKRQLATWSYQSQMEYRTYLDDIARRVYKKAKQLKTAE